MARPKKETDILPNGWKESILNLYKEGASDVEVRGLIYDWLDTFSQSLWSRWIDEDEEFCELISKGRGISVKCLKKYKSSRMDKINKKRREKRNYKKEYQLNKLACSARSLLYYHLRNNGKAKSKKTFEYFGFSPKQYTENIKSKLISGMTLDNYGLWHVDHIKPLSMFNLKKDEEIKKAWAFDNLQCLWARDNISKGNRYEEG